MKFNVNMDDWGPATTLVVVATIIVLVVGGIVVIVGDSLSFDQYINSIIGAAVALGILSVGRGIRMQHQPVKPRRQTEPKENPASTPKAQKGR